MPPSRDSPTLLASDSAIAPSAVVHTIDSFLTNVAEEFGAYQRRHYAIVGSAWISVAIATLSMVVTGKAPQWHPYGDPKFAHNISTEPPPCGEGQDFVLVNTWESTTGEWSLVCEAAGLAALLSTLFFVGFGVGALGLGSAADRFGRRPTCQLAASISALGSALSALAQTPQTYALCRLVAGIGTGGLSTASYVLATEIIGPSWQGVTGVGMSGIFSTGALLLVPISLLLPAWRGVNACAALCSMLNLLLFRFVDESPRWLHANGQSDRAALILQLVAIGNGHQCPSPPKLAPPGGHAPTLCSGCTSSSSSPPPGSSAATFDAVSQATSDAAAATLPPTEAPSIGALFSSRVMRWRTIGMVYCWFAASFSYYGLSLNSGNLGGSLLLNFGLSSVVELPSYAMAVVMLGRLGRRATLALGFGVGGVGCVACLALPPGAPTVLAATVGKFFVTAAFGSVFVYAGELFPTVLRSAAVGMCSTAARVGGAVAPPAVALAAIANWLPLFVFGASSILASAIIAFGMPETLGMPLAETLADSERFAAMGRNARGRTGDATEAQEVL